MALSIVPSKLHKIRKKKLSYNKQIKLPHRISMILPHLKYVVLFFIILISTIILSTGSTLNDIIFVGYNVPIIGRSLPPLEYYRIKGHESLDEHSEYELILDGKKVFITTSELFSMNRGEDWVKLIYRGVSLRYMLLESTEDVTVFYGVDRDSLFGFREGLYRYFDPNTNMVYYSHKNPYLYRNQQLNFESYLIGHTQSDRNEYIMQVDCHTGVLSREDLVSCNTIFMNSHLQVE